VAADVALADIRDGNGWRVQGWVRASDLSNSSSSVGAGRLTTTPASDQYATPALGVGLNAAWRIASGDWSWELGSDARLAEGQANERFRYQGGGFTRGRESGGRTSVAGVYLEASHDAPGQVLALGARLDAWSQTDAVRRERDLATGALVLNSAAPDASGVTGSFRAGIRRELAPGVWVRSAAYSGFRPPTLNELHRPFRVGNDVTEANPSLRPETLAGLEAGLGGAGGAWTWSASLFANRLSDPITNVTVGFGPGTFPVAGFIPAGGVLRQRRNAGRIDAFGLEAEARGKAGPVDLRAALAWTDSQVDGGTSAPQLTGLRPAQTARLTATASAAWTVGDRAGVELSVRQEGERFDDDLNTRRLKAALTLDGRVTWALSDETRLYLAVDNLANAPVQAAVSGDGVVGLAAPRLVRIGVSLRR
jgi:outer membrane receptor protein involved in Fe transport